MLLLVVLMILVTSAMVFYTLLKPFIAKESLNDRIKRYISVEEVRSSKQKQNHREFKSGLGLLAKGVGNARFLDGYRKTTQAKLTRAHILLKAEEFIAVSIVISIMFALIAVALLRSGSTARMVFVAIGLGIAGWVLPSIVLKSKTKKRIKLLNEQLGDAIVLISNSLKAGYSFLQAVDTVAREMKGPIGEEFIQLQKEISLGMTTEKALENLVSRVSSDDLELVVTAVLIQRQIGGNLSEILDNISNTIRERVKIKGEIKTVTAQGRMSGIVISLLPPILGLLIFVINPEHIMLLFQHPVGIGILIFSAFMEFIGIILIRKIVSIEV